MSDVAASAGASAASASSSPPTSSVLRVLSVRVPASVPRREEAYSLAPSDWIIPQSMSIQLLYFFRVPSGWPAAEEFLGTEKLAHALERLLVFYPFLGGKLAHTEQGEYEVRGMDEALPFVIATTETTLDQLPLGEDYTSTRSLPASLTLLPAWDHADGKANSLLQVQHTRFACGGVCIGLRMHHSVVDGAAFFTFVRHWAELYRTGGSELADPPVIDRTPYIPSEEEIARRLATHKEVAYEVVDADKPTLSLYKASAPCIGRMFRFSGAELAALKKDASAILGHGEWVSTYEALTAYLHRRVYAARYPDVAQAVAEGRELPHPAPPSKNCIPTNWRPRLRNPPVSASYAGNASLVTVMPSPADPADVLREPLSATAARVHAALASSDDTYLRGVMSWIAAQPRRDRITYQFDTARDLSVTAWNKFNCYSGAQFEKGVWPTRALLPHFAGMNGIAVLFSTEEEGVRAARQAEQSLAQAAASIAASSSPPLGASAEEEPAIDVLLGLEESAMTRLEADPLFRAYGPEPALLRLVPYESAILRQRVPDVSFPLSLFDGAVIRAMKYSIQPSSLARAGAPWPAAVGMAANQWGLRTRAFMYAPSGDTANQLQVILNPEYEILHSKGPAAGAEQSVASAALVEASEMWEGCFSVPMARGRVRRPLHIRASWQDEAGAPHVAELHGWEARVWQHENDHLNGRLYDDAQAGRCVEKRTFTTLQEADEFKRELDVERAVAKAKQADQVS